MALHQYIGARYIPHFRGVYDATTQYEGLDVVDNNMGTTYISRKPVPVGTPLSNTEYWAIYGASSGAIIDLQDQINDINDDITEINKKITHRYIFIGDSYARGSGSNGWVDQVVSFMGLTSADYFVNSNGGAGFAHASNNFITLIQSLYNDISDKESITDIVVLGGANERGYEDYEISNAITTFVQYAEGTYPNAKVRIGMIAATTDPTMVGTQYDRILRGYSVCDNAEFLHNLQYVFHDYSLVGADQVHPTNAGYVFLGHKIVEALRGGCNVNYYEKPTVSFPEGFVTGTGQTPNIKVTVNNNVTSICFGQRFGIYTEDSSKYINITSGSLVKIINLNSKYILGVEDSSYNAWNFTTIPCFMYVHSTVNNQRSVLTGQLVLYKGTIYAQSYDPIIATTSAYTSVDEVVIVCGSMVGDTMFF